MSTDAAGTTHPPKRRPIVVFDDACSMCTRSMRVVDAIDRFKRLDRIGWTQSQQTDPPLAAGIAGDGLRVVHRDGRIDLGIDAVRAILVRTPLAPIGWALYLPGLHWLGARAYGLVARRRMRMSCVIGER